MTVHDARLWKLFARYVAGECSDREVAEVEALIAVDEAKARLLDELRALCEETAAPDAPVSAVDMAWSKLDHRIRQASKVRPLTLHADAAPRSRRADAHRRSGIRSFLLVAVIVAAVMLGGHLFMRLGAALAPTMAPKEAKVFVTERGQQAAIQLIDGTNVRLNVDSRLTLLSDFESATREVQIDGEAYFDVAPDAERPFVVQTELGSVRVLGTAFGVRAYPGVDQVQIAVREGRVAMRSRKRAPSDTMHLSPRDLGLLMAGGEHVVRRSIDLEQYLAWTEGRLAFQNAPFDEVTRQLERWYGLDVELARPAEGLDGLTASFTDEPLSEILDVIATALNLRYRRDGKKIIFIEP